MWIEVVLFLLLAVCAVTDGIRKEIPLALVWIGIVFAVICQIWGGMEEGTWMEIVLSVLPGVAFWGISRISGGKVGYGDGWMLVMIGLFTDLRRCFMILLVGLMLESAMALILLALRRISTDKEMPFAPFLLLGMGVVVWL